MPPPQPPPPTKPPNVPRPRPKNLPPAPTNNAHPRGNKYRPSKNNHKHGHRDGRIYSQYSLRSVTRNHNHSTRRTTTHRHLRQIVRRQVVGRRVRRHCIVRERRSQTMCGSGRRGRRESGMEVVGVGLWGLRLVAVRSRWRCRLGMRDDVQVSEWCGWMMALFMSRIDVSPANHSDLSPYYCASLLFDLFPHSILTHVPRILHRLRLPHVPVEYTPARYRIICHLYSYRND
jgi:U5 snRNP spliceosome subunit